MQRKPEIGFNLQITKVTDLGGGHETVTINTACPPDSSAEALYGKIKLMAAALQKQIDTQREKEQRRQEHERAAVAKLSERMGVNLEIAQPQGLRTPVDLPAPPIANGHDQDTE